MGGLLFQLQNLKRIEDCTWGVIFGSEAEDQSKIDLQSKPPDLLPTLHLQLAGPEMKDPHVSSSTP